MMGLVVASALGLLATRAECKTSVELGYTGARNYGGEEFKGSVDLNKDHTAQVDGLYQHVDSDIASQPSSTNQVTGGVSGSPNDSNDWRSSLSYWNDSINLIHYVGPSAGYTHTWLTDDDDKTELFGASLDADLFFYSANVDVATTGKTVKKGTPPPVKTTAEILTTSQFHPNLNLEKPLFNETVIPFATASHSFYSTDPSAIESSVNRRGVSFTPATLNDLNSMVGGFTKNTWSVGATLAFPTKTLLRLEFGKEQLATDNSWATEYSAKVNQAFGEHLTAELGWNHTIEDNVPVDYGLAQATYAF